MADGNFDLEVEFKTLTDNLGQKFTKFETELKENGNVSKETKADLKAMADDFAKLQKDVTTLSDELTAVQQKRLKAELPAARMTMGRALIDSEEFKAFADGRSGRARVEVKNTILGEAGSPPEPVDTIAHYQSVPGIVAGAFRPMSLFDWLPKGIATSNTIHWTRESGFTNNAAETAEGAAKPESVLTFEAVDTPIRTVAHIIKASKQILEDVPMLQSYIDARMTYGVQLKVQNQIVAGTGAGKIHGLANTANHTDLAGIVTADNDFDAANKAKHQVIASDYMADAYLVNPADWGRLERKRTGISSDETPLAGQSGTISYFGNGMQPMLWGLPVILSNSVTAGKFYAVSRDALMWWARTGIAVEIFEQDSDNVQKNLLTIRGEVRGAFTVFQKAAVIEGSWPEAA